MSGQVPFHRLASALETQAWVRRGGNAVPMPEAFTSATVDPGCPRQKPKGGMWTSTYLGPYGSGWCQWCLDETFDCERENPIFPMWTLEPDPAARVFEIATYADLEALVNEYPHRRDYPDRGFGRWTNLHPHWEKIAEDFDAVHLTDQGQWDTRLTHPLGLYGWDCESTVWFRWMFTAVTELGEVHVEPRPDAWYLENEAAA